MGKWSVYHSDGTPLRDVDGKEISTRSLEYSGTWMGECFVTVTFENESPIDFSIGDYLEYRGERFEINYDPGKIKCSGKGSYGGAFKYDQVKFNAMMDELVRSEFLDVVLYDNELHYTSLPKFAFYVSSLDDLADRIQANLNEQFGSGQWKIFTRNKERSLQRGCTSAEWDDAYGEGTEDNVIESTSISASSNTCWDALGWVNSQFDVNFIVRGRNVYIGTAGVPTANIFKYGKGKGLYELEQNADSDQLVCTRLRAYGSTKNLPTRYYAKLGATYSADVYDVYQPPAGGNSILVTLDAEYYSYYFSTKAPDVNGGYDNPSSGYVVTVKVGDVEVVGNMGASVKTIDDKDVNKWGVLVRYEDGSTRPDYTTKEKFTAFKEAVGTAASVSLVSGFVWSRLPSSLCSYSTDNLPNNMAINTLMLPGFPTQSLSDWWDAQSDSKKKLIYSGEKSHVFSSQQYRPYIDSDNAKVVGIRPSSVFFDTDDEVNGIIEIYPTIEEMEVDGIRIDEIDTGTSIDDDGTFSDGETVANVSVYLKPQVNFDINALKGDDFTIHMKDGMCGGREFKVASSDKGSDGRWQLMIKRTLDDDLGLYFPYKDFQINAGDHFVLTGIELPDAYVEAASERLLKYSLMYLDENDYTRYVYTPKVDEIFMARQHDEAMSDATGTLKSLHDTLKEGDIMLFEDEDLGIDAQISIDQLTIKEDDGKIPTYGITLREDKEVGTIQKIQNQISSLASGNGGSGGGITSAQVRELIPSVGGEYFLSKLSDDEAEGKINFKKGVTFGDGKRYGIEKDGDAVLGDIVGGDASLERVHDNESGESQRVLVGAQGFDLYKASDGRAYLWVDVLNVRTRAYFASLEIRKVSYSGGTLLMSPAGSTLVRVTPLYGTDGKTVLAYKCHATADDGETATMNWWKVGMQALCQTFNIEAGRYEDVANQYYWRLVVDTGQEELEDGKLYDYVTLSDVERMRGDEAAIPYSDGENTAYASLLEKVSAQDGRTDDQNGASIASRYFYGKDARSAAPKAGDVIVCAGDQVLWRKRGNVVRITTSTDDGDDGNAPSITMYHGVGAPYTTGETDADGEAVVNPYVWKTVTSLQSPDEWLINADKFKMFSGDLDNIIEPLATWYEVSPSTAYLTRHADGTTTPTDVTYVLRKHVGDKVTPIEDKVAWTAAYTLTDGTSKDGVSMDGGKLSDLGVDLSTIDSVRVTAWEDGVERGYNDLVVVADTKGTYTVAVTSDTGDKLVNGQGSCTLTATVYKDGEDVTGTIAPASFSWERDGMGDDDDATWNKLHQGVGNVITVSDEDIYRSATFKCTVYNL